MSVSVVILNHYPERQGNIRRMLADLAKSTVRPDEVIIFVDDPLIQAGYDGATVIRASRSFPPLVRFALGLTLTTDYCLFLDDDLTVRPHTLANFLHYASLAPEAILGLEGNRLGKAYTDGLSVNRGGELIRVDVLIRTYFVPRSRLSYGFLLRASHPTLPAASLDDVYLCLGNTYLGQGQNLVIPVDEASTVTELDPAGRGQCLSPQHYLNRDLVCQTLKEAYDR